jgi:hypothetical protein
MTSILLTNTAYRPCIGGIENSLHYIAKSYEKAGVRTLVACSDQTPSGVGRLPAREEIDGIEVRRYANLGRWINGLGLTPSGNFLQALRFLRGRPMPMPILKPQPVIMSASTASSPGSRVLGSRPSSRFPTCPSCMRCRAWRHS